MCHSARSSFGLGSDKTYIYEEIFQIAEHCKNVSYEAVWDMPVAVRKWWIGRKNKLEKDREEQSKGNKQQDNPTPIPAALRSAAGAK